MLVQHCTVNPSRLKCFIEAYLLLFFGIPFALQQLFDVATTFDETLNHTWEHARFDGGVGKRRKRTVFVAILTTGLIGGPIDCREAEVILLDEGRIQTVEIEEQDKGIVQALLGFQHQTSAVLGLTSGAVFGVAFAWASLFWREKLETMEFVQKKVLGSFRSVALECVRPNVARNACKLLGEWQYLQFEHEPLNELGIKECRLRQIDNRFTQLEPLRNIHGLNFLARNLELRRGQIAQRVRRFFQQLLGTEICIAEQTA